MKNKLIYTLVFGSILALSTLFASQAQAHGYYGYRGGYYYNNNNWVAPAVAGVVIGGLAARAYYTPPVYVQQPVYGQPPVYVQQPYPANYHQETILDSNCNCYRNVLVPN